jgi:hypothetical protein
LKEVRRYSADGTLLSRDTHARVICQYVESAGD